MAKSLSELFDEEYKKALPRMRMKLKRSAQRHHRFKNRTHDLKNSVGTRHDKEHKKLTLVAPVVSPFYNIPYAQYIIRGHGTWLPDPFLQDALDREDDYIKEQYQKAMNIAVDRFNNQSKGNSSGRVYNGI